MKNRTASVMSAALAAAFAGVAVAGDNLLVNGDLEEYLIDPAEWQLPLNWDATPAGSTALPGWTVGGDGGGYVSDVFWETASGSGTFELWYTSGGSIAQTVATIPGEVYTLTFAMSGDPVYGPPGLRTTRVTTGDLVQDYTVDISGNNQSNMNWTPFTATFEATCGATLIKFEGVGGASFSGPAVDAIVLTGPPGCTGDLTLDEFVDASDLAALLAAWGDRPGDEDLDCDGLVGPADLAILLSAWGACP